MQYKVVDVFTDVPFKGNPVAVVRDDAGKLSGEQMLAIARWLNLSETTFVVPNSRSDADYKLRIFTIMSELPFAGHPTLGTLHAVKEWGLVATNKSSWVQDCPRGDVEVRQKKVGSSEVLSFGIDGLTSTPVAVSELDDCLPGLTIAGHPATVDAGPLWTVIEVNESPKQLLDMKPNWPKITEFGVRNNSLGLCVFARTGPSSEDIELRTFVADERFEDPVCGSGNAAVAYYRDLQRPYRSSQGSAMTRNGQIHVDYSENKIWISGACTTVINGEINV